MTVEIDMELLLTIAFQELPKVRGISGGEHTPRLLREGWVLEGGDEPVPATELARMRHWWPRFMDEAEGDLLS